MSALTGESGLPISPDVIPISALHQYSVPVLGTMAAGEPTYDKEFPDIYVESPLNADFALRVRGDSMEPTYLNGDLVYVKQFPSLPFGGAIVIVSIDDDVAIKHLNMTEGGVIVTSDNSAYPPKFYSGTEHEIRILGIPVGYLRMYKKTQKKNPAR